MTASHVWASCHLSGTATPADEPRWEHRTHFVANTRWWPPFCMVVDWVVAGILVIEIAAGLHFR